MNTESSRFNGFRAWRARRGEETVETVGRSDAAFHRVQEGVNEKTILSILLSVLPCLSRNLVLISNRMILTTEELHSLVELIHQSPHTLLGMHPLGDKPGVVARALLPDAAKVALEPVLEKDKPAFELRRIPNTDVFEGVTKAANRVYAYDLVVTDHDGTKRRTRDAYSFLPTLGESDLYLFGKGDERKIYEKLGAQLRVD